jgi:hypothetical protein
MHPKFSKALSALVESIGISKDTDDKKSISIGSVDIKNSSISDKRSPDSLVKYHKYDSDSYSNKKINVKA